MKALLINGSPNEHGCTYTALNEVAETLRKNGVAERSMTRASGILARMASRPDIQRRAVSS